jgi:hypothetical protein
MEAEGKLMQINLEQAHRILELTLAEYSAIRGDYWARVYDAVYAYLTSKDTIARHKNEIGKAMAEAFNNTGDLAYVDGGAELPMDEDTQSWLASRQSAEFGYVDSLFQNLKMLRAEEDTDPIHEAFIHADGYAKTLDNIYANVKVMAAGNKMLTLVGQDGKVSCPECKKYKNKRHRAKWWVAHNLVPGIGSSYSCGGWQCFHVLQDDNGMLFTI